MTRRVIPHGTSSALDAEVLLAGEIAIDDTNDELRIGDGNTLGGVKMARADQVSKTFESFLPLTYNPASDDCSTELVAAAVWSAANDALVIFGGHYRIENCATITSNNVRFHFDGAQFDVLDTGTAGTLVGGSTGKIGFLFKEADNLTLTGSVYLEGQGTVSVTSLAGMVFDNCDKVNAPVMVRVKTMAAGRFVWQCDQSLFGDIIGEEMDGLQTFEAPPTTNAGTTEVIVGCQHSVFGNATSYNGEKPCRYLSLDSAQRQTEFCEFGSTIFYGKTGSLTAHSLAIRNGRNCSFGAVIGAAGTSILQIIAYSGDTVAIDGNVISSVNGTGASTAASVDSAVVQETTGNAIGRNIINSVDTTVAGESGILVTSGSLSIGIARLQGAATRLVQVFASTGTAVLHFNKLEIRDNTGSSVPVNVGKSGLLSIGFLDFQTGPTAALTAGARYEPALGSGSAGKMLVGNMRYAQNGSANNYVYIFFDLTNGFEQHEFGNIEGTGATAQLYFAGDEFNVKHGEFLSTIAPTAGTYTLGSKVWLSNPAVGGKLGWLCTTAGTPGTWSAFGIAGGAQSAAPSTTYAAPSGGATIDTEGRASLAQLAVDLADLKTKLAAAKLTA